MAARSGGTRRSATSGGVAQAQPQPPVASPGVTALKPLKVPAALTVHDLAELMGVGTVELIKEFMRRGFMFTVNEVVGHDVAALAMPAFGYSLLPLEEEKEPGSLVVSGEGEDQSLLVARPPVVTILGHVDHGKTTLLDVIRKSDVVAGEAGGITQHIGAYQVEYGGHPITFLDTPGHEAFTAMRARGARVTDIAVLVVAADDGIMPQTVEAISHARAAGVPIMVAISKVDKPEADVERVNRQLAEHNLLIEAWGGDVIAVPLSAEKGQGISELLENILVVAEVNELKANPDREARGVVVEARTDKSKGTVATILMQTGTLLVGDSIVISDMKGRVKAMFTDRGRRIQKAGPSQPVEVLGMDDLPQAGDIMVAAPDEKTARQMVEERAREKELRRLAGPTLEDVHTRIETGEVKALNLIIKTDVQGSVEVVRSSLEALSTEQTRVNIIHAASGSITESDVLLAVASQAIIIGFNSLPEPGARALANQEGVEIRHYDVIYHLTDEVEKALTGLLEPVVRDVVEGHATVRTVFDIGRRGKVAGFYVNEGRIARGSTIHVLRDGKVLYSGPISSLRHLKGDVREVTVEFEGGVILEKFNDYQEGDVLEAHRSEQDEPSATR